VTRILTFDVETMPLEARAFGIWNQNIGINQIVANDYLACFAAKFLGERKVHFYSAWDDGPRKMALALHKLLDEADAVAGWNSDKFDLRWANRVFVESGKSPPSPFVKVDLMKSVRRQVYLPSYKLDFVSRWLGLGGKLRTGGFDLWADVLSNDPKAQNKMRQYNIRDTRLTEKVFIALASKGWIKSLPNRSIDDGHVCPSCGSEKLQARGYAVTATRRYRRFQCNSCGAWSRAVHCEKGSAELKAAA
jgi:DNA polymerase elongation subunit (family B)